MLCRLRKHTGDMLTFTVSAGALLHNANAHLLQSPRAPTPSLAAVPASRSSRSTAKEQWAVTAAPLCKDSSRHFGGESVSAITRVLGETVSF
jgi:hypothetical protein